MNIMNPITVVSKWPLKNGCPPELIKALEKLTEMTRSQPGVLIYLVNLQAPFPVDSNGSPICPYPNPIPLNEQKEIVFIESYSSVQAFSDHFKSPAVTDFLRENIKYFREDPNNPGFPDTAETTEFLDRRFSIYSETKA
ncbi:putative quinol monooxygenase [Crocosphaera chwakensis]|uniref:ABM domain-containing protein n=1 Tax=Crocosphaera chwakensis CCY0110 TaxID=391612 RepID=A3ILA1_9CHRO|nr:antibiotic biosynthesis monooxygenase [Crocosphaera chwakensis]EAZ92970.1 hypothetical protein CY0110_22777 [Crocosphaera chwakensis CCY0110]